MGDAGSERGGPPSPSTDTSFSESVGCEFAPRAAHLPFDLVAAHFPTMRILRKSPVAADALVPTPRIHARFRCRAAISFGVRPSGL